MNRPEYSRGCLIWHPIAAQDLYFFICTIKISKYCNVFYLTIFFLNKILVLVNLIYKMARINFIYRFNKELYISEYDENLQRICLKLSRRCNIFMTSINNHSSTTFMLNIIPCSKKLFRLCL